VAKGQNVLDSGAGGYVLANDEANAASLSADQHVLPAVHVTYEDGVMLKAWIAATPSPQASISPAGAAHGHQYADIMAASSSRGPNPLVTAVDDIIKPDVTAPGVSILAAGGVGDPNPPVWEIMSGTSMASPHAAGTAALVRALHPDWSPAEIASAIMTTPEALPIKEDGVTPGDPHDYGAGRIDAALAVKAGLVLDVAPSAFAAANPALGGDPSALNLASLGKAPAVGMERFQRRVRNVRPTAVTWSASVQEPDGVSLTVDPAEFTLAAGEARTVNVYGDVSRAALGWAFGEVSLSPSSADIPASNFPLALNVSTTTLPTALFLEGIGPRGGAVVDGTKVKDAITQLTMSDACLAPAALYEIDIVQDPDNNDPFDHWPPDPLSDGVYYLQTTVPSGTRRLVADIIDSSSPDLGLYLYRWDGAQWHLACASVNWSSSDEYCNIDDPASSDIFWIVVQNWQASDPSGVASDTVKLAIAEVPTSDCGNVSGEILGSASRSLGQPFPFRLGWDLVSDDAHWYGAFALGGSAATAGEFGRFTVDLDLITSDDGADVDGNGSVAADSDAKLVLRYLLGFGGPILVDGAVAGDCSRCAAADLAWYIEQMRTLLDIDGNGVTDALTDGLLFYRYLRGYRGAALAAGAVGDRCSRCDGNAIADYCAGLVP
jgi:hypothetical protein